jgi:hypothetical protein
LLALCGSLVLLVQRCIFAFSEEFELGHNFSGVVLTFALVLNYFLLSVFLQESDHKGPFIKLFHFKNCVYGPLFPFDLKYLFLEEPFDKALLLER